MEITRYGHSSLLVTADQARILFDPGVFSLDAAFALGNLDAIVITHQHVDHLDPVRLPRLLAENPDARLLADPETVSLQDSDRWEATAAGAHYRMGDLQLSGIGGMHAEILPQITRIANIGMLVQDAESTLFNPGDSYDYVPQGVDVDVLALPLAAPWSSIGAAVGFAQRVAPRTIIPIHDGALAERAYDVYWSHVVNHAGAEDIRRLGVNETLTVP